MEEGLSHEQSHFPERASGSGADSSAARPGLSGALPEAVAKPEHIRWGSCKDNLEVTLHLASTIRERAAMTEGLPSQGSPSAV